MTRDAPIMAKQADFDVTFFQLGIMLTSSRKQASVRVMVSCGINCLVGDVRVWRALSGP